MCKCEEKCQCADCKYMHYETFEDSFFEDICYCTKQREEYHTGKKCKSFRKREDEKT